VRKGAAGPIPGQLALFRFPD